MAHHSEDYFLTRTSVVTKAAIQDCDRHCQDIQELNRSCSLGLAAGDYVLFLTLESDLRGKKFISDEEVVSAVMNYFKVESSEYFFSDRK